MRAGAGGGGGGAGGGVCLVSVALDAARAPAPAAAGGDCGRDDACATQKTCAGTAGGGAARAWSRAACCTQAWGRAPPCSCQTLKSGCCRGAKVSPKGWRAHAVRAVPRPREVLPTCPLSPSLDHTITARRSCGSPSTPPRWILRSSCTTRASATSPPSSEATRACGRATRSSFASATRGPPSSSAPRCTGTS